MLPADSACATEQGSLYLYPVTDAALGLVPPQVSTHAQNSLRRIVTHETAGGVDLDLDGLGIPRTHNEDGDEEKKTENGLGRECPTLDLDAQGKDGLEKATGTSGVHMDEATLQDQTNLLPTKQVLMVFIGLTAAIFCSLLDQTMCVLLSVRVLTPPQCYDGHSHSWESLWSRRHILMGGDGVPIDLDGERPGRGRVTPR
jgi:hypothetical protein